MLSPSTSAQPSPARKSSPMINACAAFRLWLHGELQLNAERTAVTQQPLKGGKSSGVVITRISNARQHQHGERIVNHRLVIHRQQLFGYAAGDRMQPGARAAGEYDTFIQSLDVAVSRAFSGNAIKITPHPDWLMAQIKRQSRGFIADNAAPEKVFALRIQKTRSLPIISAKQGD